MASGSFTRENPSEFFPMASLEPAPGQVSAPNRIAQDVPDRYALPDPPAPKPAPSPHLDPEILSINAWNRQTCSRLRHAAPHYQGNQHDQVPRDGCVRFRHHLQNSPRTHSADIELLYAGRRQARGMQPRKGRSLNPVMEASSGKDRPRRCNASMAPCARRSLVQEMAIDGQPNACKSVAQREPSSSSNRQEMATASSGRSRSCSSASCRNVRKRNSPVEIALEPAIRAMRRWPLSSRCRSTRRIPSASSFTALGIDHGSILRLAVTTGIPWPRAASTCGFESCAAMSMMPSTRRSRSTSTSSLCAPDHRCEECVRDVRHYPADRHRAFRPESAGESVLAIHHSFRRTPDTLGRIPGQHRLLLRIGCAKYVGIVDARFSRDGPERDCLAHLVRQPAVRLLPSGFDAVSTGMLQTVAKAS